MDDSVKILVKHQVETNISEETMCSDIGIARKTFYNLKRDITRPHESTLEVINNYITKENINVI